MLLIRLLCWPVAGQREPFNLPKWEQQDRKNVNACKRPIDFGIWAWVRDPTITHPWTRVAFQKMLGIDKMHPVFWGDILIRKVQRCSRKCLEYIPFCTTQRILRIKYLFIKHLHCANFLGALLPKDFYSWLQKSSGQATAHPFLHLSNAPFKALSFWENLQHKILEHWVFSVIRALCTS